MFSTNRLLFSALALSLFTFTTSCKLISDDSITETVGSVSSDPAPIVDFSVVEDNGSSTPPNDNPSTLPPPDLNPGDVEFEEGFSINNDALYTNQLFVNLTFRTLAPSKIKIGRSLNCADGQWENYVEQKRINLLEFNTPITYSVMFQDWEGGRSVCYRKSIVHDDVGPEIVFQTYPPASVEVGSAADVSFYVRDDRSETVSVNCSLNGISKACFYGHNKVSLPQLPVGAYTFTVTATDDLQNTTTRSVSWNVHTLYKNIVQKLTVNDYKKVDILFVIDNSGSMAYEQQSMAQRTSQFLTILQGLDYQIAITTTDPRNINLGDGRLIPLTGGNGKKIIDATMPVSTAQNLLSQTLQRPETGSGDEQGIRSVYRAIERYGANESDFRMFFRDGAQLSVVLISDEDESANTLKNDPAGLLSLINSTWSGQKRFNFNSIITRPQDTACRNTYGYSYGERYKTISDLTGGVIGNVCDMDYTNQVSGIADEIRRLLKTITLSCPPLSQFPVVIKKDGVTVSQPYTVEGLNIKFTKELNPGAYEVEYTCLK